MKVVKYSHKNSINVYSTEIQYGHLLKMLKELYRNRRFRLLMYVAVHMSILKIAFGTTCLKKMPMKLTKCIPINVHNA